MCASTVILSLLPLLTAVTAVTHISNCMNGWRFDHLILGCSMVWPEIYSPKAVIYSRFQMTQDGRVFVVSPRFRPGVPFTLGTFQVTADNRAVVEPNVLPFPALPQVHRVPNENTADRKSDNLPKSLSLVNIIDLYLENTDDSLWLLDIGSVNTMEKPKYVVPPKIIRLDLNDDEQKVCVNYIVRATSSFIHESSIHVDLNRT